MTTHVSCRLPAALGEQLDSAAAQNNAFRSELVRRAIRYYVRENPDGLDILDQPLPTNSERSEASSLGNNETASDQSRANTPYDPTEEVF